MTGVLVIERINPVAVVPAVVSIPASKIENSKDIYCDFIFVQGLSVCQGDSGGGLVFSERRRGEEIWHLRALVSVAPVETNLRTNRTTCRFDTYSAFTEVYKHKDWMIQILRGLKLLLPT